MVLTDSEYIDHMIPHHQVAIDVSKQIMPYTKLIPIIAICRNIIRSQEYEIWEMKNMKIGNDNLNNDNKSHNMDYNNIITEIDFLKHMIPHHQVAIDMSIKLLLYTINPYMISLAKNVIIQQRFEIIRMNDILNSEYKFFESLLLK
jgi:uncharacterized protein (DUF305 family)